MAGAQTKCVGSRILNWTSDFGLRAHLWPNLAQRLRPRRAVSHENANFGGFLIPAYGLLRPSKSSRSGLNQNPNQYKDAPGFAFDTQLFLDRLDSTVVKPVRDTQALRAAFRDGLG